jgi:hypothetical protein
MAMAAAILVARGSDAHACTNGRVADLITDLSVVGLPVLFTAVGPTLRRATAYLQQSSLSSSTSTPVTAATRKQAGTTHRKSDVSRLMPFLLVCTIRIGVTLDSDLWHMGLIAGTRTAHISQINGCRLY